MSLHQTNKDKPRAQKCRHFCFSIDLHNYCPTCREAGKGDNPCVTFETPCHICASFTDEQMKKIQNRKRYLKKQKAETSSKDNELDLLGEGDGIPSLAQRQTSRVLLTIFLPHPPPTPTPPPHPSSATCLQFFISQNTSQICPTHPRYSFTTKNSNKY